MVPNSYQPWDNLAGTSRNPEVMMKSKRIVYRMKKLIDSAEVDDDFEQVLDTLSMPKQEKRVAIDQMQKVRENIRSSIKTSIKSGQPEGFLSQLNPEVFEKFRKRALSMLINSANTNLMKSPEDSDRDSRYGEEVVVGRVQVIASSEDFQMSKNSTHQKPKKTKNGRSQVGKNVQNDEEVHPEPPRPQGIPRLDVGLLRDELEVDRSDDNFSDLKSGDPIPSPFDGFYKNNQKLDAQSARMMADLMNRLDIAEKKNKQLESEVEREKRKKRVIASRPRPVPKQEIAVQTTSFRPDEPEKREIMVQTSDLDQIQRKDASVDVQSLADPTEFKKTPRVEEDDSESNYSDMSEGEFRIKRQPIKLISVRSDGECIFDSDRSIEKPSQKIPTIEVKDGEAQTSQRTPRVIEDYDEDEMDMTPRPSQLSGKSEDILILSNRNKANSSDLRVAERTISNSSIDTSSSPMSLESSLNSMQMKVQRSLMSKSAEPAKTSQAEGSTKQNLSSSSLPPIKIQGKRSKMYENASTSEEEGTASDADDESVSV